MNDRGFTLIEVLVSLAIFSLAIVGLNRAAAAAAAGTANLGVTVHGGFVADNAIVRSRALPLREGTQRFEASSGGMDFEIVVETSETELDGFYNVESRVNLRDQERVVATRRGFRAEEIVTVTPPSETNADE